MGSQILLAEDNERLALMLQKFLEALGHRVLLAADGVAALEALQQGGIDLLLLDLKLPRLSGIELLQRMQRNPAWKELPVIIMTGAYRGGNYATAAARLGVRAYLEKPFTREAFLQAVSSVIDAAPARGNNLVEFLIELHDARDSGTLELAGGTRIALVHGEPVSFSSPEFIPFLAGSGHLGSADLERYCQQGCSRLQLTQAGLLSYDELLEQSRLFLSKRLIQAIDQQEPARFDREQREIEPPLTPVPLPRLLHQAARAAAPRFAVDSFLSRHGTSFPAKNQCYFRRANLLRMGRDEIELLELMKPGRSMAELIGASTDRGAAASFLTFLIRMGMISLHPAPAPDQGADFPQKRLFNRPIEEVAEADAETMSFEDLVEEVSDSVELVVGEEGMAAPLSSSEINFEQDIQRDYAAIQDKNYYEIFSLTQGSFSFAALKDAYFSKTRQYSPEKFMQLSGATLAQAQDVLSHYASAYNTLSSVVAKERYDEMLTANSGLDGKQDDELQARIQFQSGKVFLEMEDYKNAERALQEAYTLNPQDCRTCAFLAWSIYKNSANAGSSASHDKCRMLLSKSLQMGRCGEAFTFRGWLLLDEGRDSLAEGEFQKALKMNARDRLALNGMRQITERREAEKKGLFKRIFG